MAHSGGPPMAQRQYDRMCAILERDFQESTQSDDSFLFNRWFDLNISWFFVNGRKIDSYNEKLKKKYGKGVDI